MCHVEALNTKRCYLQSPKKDRKQSLSIIENTSLLLNENPKCSVETNDLSEKGCVVYNNACNNTSEISTLENVTNNRKRIQSSTRIQPSRKRKKLKQSSQTLLNNCDNSNRKSDQI